MRLFPIRMFVDTEDRAFAAPNRTSRFVPVRTWIEIEDHSLAWARSVYGKDESGSY